MEIVLNLFKIDMGINHTKRDMFFISFLEAQKRELEGRGIDLDLMNIEDQILLSDLSAWNYRKRNEDVELSRNLQSRIRNRIVKGRSLSV